MLLLWRQLSLRVYAASLISTRASLPSNTLGYPGFTDVVKSWLCCVYPAQHTASNPIISDIFFAE